MTEYQCRNTEELIENIGRLGTELFVRNGFEYVVVSIYPCSERGIWWQAWIELWNSDVKVSDLLQPAESTSLMGTLRVIMFKLIHKKEEYLTARYG